MTGSWGEPPPGGASGWNPAPSPPSWGSTPAPESGSWGAPATGPAASGGQASGSAPWIWLLLALGVLLVAILLGLLAHGKPALSIAGWLLAGFGAIGMLAAFTVADTRRRANPWYSPGAAPSRLRGALAFFALAVVALNAWQFADWAGRR